MKGRGWQGLAGSQKDGFDKFRIGVRVGFGDPITYVTFDLHGAGTSILLESLGC